MAPELSSWRAVDSDLGVFVLGGDEHHVRRVLLPDELAGPLAPGARSAVVDEAAAQLAAYLAGELREFEVPLRSTGTPFQEAVWELLRQIPYGETRTYGWVADGVDRPGAPRAAGQALGRNPIPILRGCHRVVAAGGLGGYGGGEGLKARLLELEGAAWPVEALRSK